jgi:hypothetical protein
MAREADKGAVWGIPTTPQVLPPLADDGKDLNLDQATTPTDWGRFHTREGICESF